MIKNFDFHHKSTVSEICSRFDNDVERFSNLDTGQSSVVDSTLAMELITQAALRCNPSAKTLLDIGCGAGNNSLKLLMSHSPLDCDLVDLSRPMLERAKERLSAFNDGVIRVFQGDFRDVELPDSHYDIIFAGAVLHHLRDESDWLKVFQKIFRLTASGGSVWITDLVAEESSEVSDLMREHYGDYLASIGGSEYRDGVFAYIDKEDSPRPLTYQLDLLRKVGFTQVDVLHKNLCFAAFGGRRL